MADCDEQTTSEIKVVVFPVTYRCNARCVMCSIGGMSWSDRPISFFEPFFASRLVKAVESVNITGGEPTLRSDLPELVGMVAARLPRLRELLISTNGLRPQGVVERTRQVLASVPRHVQVWAFVSLDALDASADLVRGLDGAGGKARETILLLSRLQEECRFRVGISCTITRHNAHAIEEVRAFGRELGLYVDFPYATVNTTYINSAPKAAQFVTTKAQDEVVAQFYGSLAKEPLSAASVLYYRRMQRYLSIGKVLHGDCVYRSGAGVLLEPDGKIRVCGMSDDSLMGDMAIEDVTSILGRARPSMLKHCGTCTTNSYGGWAKDAQALAKTEMLERIRTRRHAAAIRP